MDTPIPTTRIGRVAGWFGCNRDPLIQPGGFSQRFKGKSHKQTKPKQHYRDASREICEAANAVLERRVGPGRLA